VHELVLDMSWYNSRFIIIMFISYVGDMFSIVRVALCLYPCSYSAQSNDHGVGRRYCVSVVLIGCLPMNASYILGHVVDHEGDYYSFFGSSVVHSPNVGRLRLSCGVMSCSVLDPP
jgi:hypothetical protein